METGFRVFLLTLCGLSVSGCATLRHWHHHEPAPEPQSDPSDALSARAEQAQDTEPAPRVIEPEVERRKIKVPKIDSQNVELGAYFGVLSIEDFGSNPVYGVSAAYHVTEDFFFQAQAARSTAGRTSFETLGGDIQLLTNDERQLTYYNLGLGYNFLPGEVFIGRGRAMTSALYVTLGLGSTKFGGDDHVTANLGAGFRVLPTDWLSLNVGFAAHMFNSDLLGTNKLTSNLEGQIGMSVFF